MRVHDTHGLLIPLAYVNIAQCLFPLGYIIVLLFIFDEDKVLKFSCNSVCEEERGREGERERDLITHHFHSLSGHTAVKVFSVYCH